MNNELLTIVLWIGILFVEYLVIKYAVLSALRKHRKETQVDRDRLEYMFTRKITSDQR